MSRDGTRHVVEHVKHTLAALDLVTDAHSLYKLLHAADCFPAPGGLYDGVYAQLAIQRYMQIWLPLLCATPMPERAALVPPLDVAFVWLAHRLAPQSYEQDCAALCEGDDCWDPEPQQAFRFSSHTGSSSVAGTRVTAALWASHQQHQQQVRQASLASSADSFIPTPAPTVPSSPTLPWKDLWRQPYFPPVPRVNVAAHTGHGLLEMRLLTYMQSAAALLVSTLRPCYLEAGFLRQANSRYARFLALNRLVRSKNQGPATASSHPRSQQHQQQHQNQHHHQHPPQQPQQQHNQQHQQHHQQQQQTPARLLPTSDIHLLWAAHITRGGGAYPSHCHTLFGSLLQHEPRMLLHGSTVGTPLGRPNSQEGHLEAPSISLPSPKRSTSSPKSGLPTQASPSQSPPSSPPLTRVVTFSHMGPEHVRAAHHGQPSQVPRLHLSRSMAPVRSATPAHPDLPGRTRAPRASEPGNSRRLMPSASLRALLSSNLRTSDPGTAAYEGEADFLSTKQLYESSFGEMFDPVGTGPVALHSSTLVTKKMGRLLRYFDPAPKILATEGSSLRMSLVAPEPSCSWRAGGHALFMLWLVAHELWELNNVAYGLASFSDVGQSAIRCAVLKALKFCQWKYLPLHEAHPYWASFDISLSSDSLDVRATITTSNNNPSRNPKSPSAQSQSAHAGTMYRASPAPSQNGQAQSTLLEQQPASVRAVVLCGGSHRGFSPPAREETSPPPGTDPSTRPPHRSSGTGPLGSLRVLPLVSPAWVHMSDSSSSGRDRAAGREYAQAQQPDWSHCAHTAAKEASPLRAVDFEGSDAEQEAVGQEGHTGEEVFEEHAHAAAGVAVTGTASPAGDLAKTAPRRRQSDPAGLAPKPSAPSAWWNTMLSLLPPPSFPPPPSPPALHHTTSAKNLTNHRSPAMSSGAANILQHAVAEEIGQLPGVAALMKLGLGGGLPIALYTLLSSDSWVQVVKASNAEAAREWGLAATSPGAVMTSVGVY
ncbi:MAG: hypothetical protein WDW38_000373 [Sanguina aurantia]